MIREHGPATSTQKLCLFVVNSFMDDSGIAWPSQSSIAKAASLTENTVQRALAQVIDAGWLGVETRLTPGKAWKRYIYRSAVPDGLEFVDTMQTDANARLVESFLAKEGPIPEGGRPLKQKVSRNVSHVTETPKVPTLKANVPLLKTEGPPFKDEGPILNGVKVPLLKGTKSSSEVLNISSQKKFSKEGAFASERTALSKTLNLNTLKTQDPEAEKAASKERAERIRKAIKTFPNDGDADIVKVAHVTLAEVQDIRRQA